MSRNMAPYVKRINKQTHTRNPHHLTPPKEKKKKKHQHLARLSSEAGATTQIQKYSTAPSLHNWLWIVNSSTFLSRMTRACLMISSQRRICWVPGIWIIFLCGSHDRSVGGQKKERTPQRLILFGFATSFRNLHFTGLGWSYWLQGVHSNLIRGRCWDSAHLLSLAGKPSTAVSLGFLSPRARPTPAVTVIEGSQIFATIRPNCPSVTGPSNVLSCAESAREPVNSATELQGPRLFFPLVFAFSLHGLFQCSASRSLGAVLFWY